jgi:hypothetical protein
MKFKPDIIADTKKKLKDAAKDIQNDTTSAYKMKRDEIRDGLPKKYTDVLTKEEIQRSSNAGIVIGAFSLLLLIIFFVLLLAKNMGWLS